MHDDWLDRRLVFTRRWDLLMLRSVRCGSIIAGISSVAIGRCTQTHMRGHTTVAITPDERIDMLQKASQSWLELKRVINSLSEQQFTRPNTIGAWSGRDVLAHIIGWEEVAIDVIEAMEAGEPEEWPEVEGEELDAFNEELIEPFRDLPLADFRQQADDIHFRLMDLAERARTIRPDTVLGVTAEHYAEHIDDLRALKKT
jgi:hypothetical protein